MSISFSVVIPTKGRPEPLAQTLASLWATDPLPGEVLVIDADEQSSAREIVIGLQDGRVPIHYVHTEPSLTKQRNIGIDRASSDVVVFLDDDVSLPDDLFAKLERAFADPSVAGVTGWVVEPHRERQSLPRSWARRLAVPGSGNRRGSFTRYGYPRYLLPGDGPCDVQFMPGCFMSARRELAGEVRFDERLGAYALAEDEDFSYRLSRRGRLVYLPDLIVVHEKLGFRSYDSREFAKLVVRNRSYLFRKNFPQTPRSRLGFGLLLGTLVGHRLLNRDWRGALGVLEGTLNLARGHRL